MKRAVFNFNKNNCRTLRLKAIRWMNPFNGRNWLIALGLIGFAGTLKAQKPDTVYLSLESCLKVMSEKNSNIKIARQTISYYKSEQKSMRGLYLPQVGLNATFGMLSNPVELDLSPIGSALGGLYQLSAGQTQLLGAVNPLITQTSQYQQLLIGAQQGLVAVNEAEWTKTLLDEQLGKIDAQVKWPIFTGGKIRAANKASDARLYEAEATFDMVANGEVVKLVEVYRSLQLAIFVSKVRRQVVEGMELHYNEASKLAEHGMISNVEKLNASVALASAEREYRKSLNDVDFLLVVLRNLLETDTMVIPTDSLSIDGDLKTLDVYLQEAFEKNPVFKKIDSKKQLARQNLAKETSEFMPNVAIIGSYDIYRYNMSDLTPDWYVGVGVQMTLFDGLSRTHKHQSAKILCEQAESYEQKAQKEIETGVTQAYLKVTQLLDRYKTLETNLALAEEFLRATQKSFVEGFATSSQVVDANLNLAKVKTEMLQTVFEYNVAKARLNELTGENLILVE